MHILSRRRSEYHLRRLLYVACTRARDLLVFPQYLGKLTERMTEYTSLVLVGRLRLDVRFDEDSRSRSEFIGHRPGESLVLPASDDTGSASRERGNRRTIVGQPPSARAAAARPGA